MARATFTLFSRNSAARARPAKSPAAGPSRPRRIEKGLSCGALMRFRKPQDPVTIRLDGASVVAGRGEPVAVALVADGKLALARSAKFHRPRGPSCLRGACDGCLARVDDVPNVMTCLCPAHEGLVVETQNILGSREVDLLRMTDWFFPEGMNHHELFAGVPGVQSLMQAFARRVAGLGKMPL